MKESKFLSWIQANRIQANWTKSAEVLIRVSDEALKSIPFTATCTGFKQGCEHVLNASKICEQNGINQDLVFGFPRNV
jgi:hypothetical protein